MGTLFDYEFRQWFAQFLILVFLTGGLATMAVGVGLIGWSDATLRFFVTMNRWVSTRRALKPVEIPRDTTRAVQRYRIALAVFFILGAAYSLKGLIFSYVPFGLIHLLYLESLRSGAALWIADSVRWILIVGNLAGLAVGVLLAFFPQVLESLEAKGGHWYSNRRMTKGAGAIQRPLDELVVAHPHIAGWITAVAGLLIAGDYAVMLSALK